MRRRAIVTFFIVVALATVSCSALTDEQQIGMLKAINAMYLRGEITDDVYLRILDIIDRRFISDFWVTLTVGFLVLLAAVAEAI